MRFKKIANADSHFNGQIRPFHIFNFAKTDRVDENVTRHSGVLEIRLVNQPAQTRRLKGKVFYSSSIEGNIARKYHGWV